MSKDVLSKDVLAELVARLAKSRTLEALVEAARWRRKGSAGSAVRTETVVRQVESSDSKIIEKDLK